MKIVKQIPKEPPCMVTEQYAYLVKTTLIERPRLQGRANEIVAWGVENIGPFVKEWGYSSHDCTGYFHTEAAAMLFIMQWQGDTP